MKDYRIISAEEAVKLAVKDGDFVDYGFGTCYPELLDKALAKRKGELKNVKIRAGLMQIPGIVAIDSDPLGESFSYYSFQLADYERKLYKEGRVNFMPVILRLLPDIYRKHLIPVDVVFVPISKPDKDGNATLGMNAYLTRVMMQAAKTVVFEINEKYPVLPGIDGSNTVNLADADYICEGEHSAIPSKTYKEPSETEKKIAELVLSEIPNGACLGLGIGGVPAAIMSALAKSDLKDFGCHTGTISDSFMNLDLVGKLTGKNKEIDTGLITCNLATGSQELYEWLAKESKRIKIADVDYVHNPIRMGELSNFISINGGVQLDLMGQENAEVAGTRQLSGIGGQMDFLEGALRSPGGKGFVCMASARKNKDGSLTSNIVPLLSGVVSAPRTMISYVATEYGVVCLSGKTIYERAEAMISIAHPDFRDELANSLK